MTRSSARGGDTRWLARVVARGMHSAGVGVLFGLPGGGANLDVVGAAAEAGIEFVLRACQVVCVS